MKHAAAIVVDSSVDFVFETVSATEKSFAVALLSRPTVWQYVLFEAIVT